ncbi:MAG TPA: hypothetical protein VF405_08745 [Gammaproteobacteria bacterium]
MKRTKQSSRRPPPTDDGSQTERSGSESRRDLEQELEEQRAETQLLRQELDATAFKTETLEKSYAKQLAEVREKLASVQAELKEKEEILSGLGGPHEHTLRELSDALTVIKVLKKQLDQLRKQKEQSGGRQRTEKTTKARELLGNDAFGLMPAESNENRVAARPASAGDTHASGAYVHASDGDDTSDGTINSLIKDADWAERKPNVLRGQATASVEKPPEPTQAEMLSPDLVFTDKDKEKDDGR